MPHPLLENIKGVIRYQHFRGPCCLWIQDEKGGRMILWNGGTLSHHYTVLQPRRLWGGG